MQVHQSNLVSTAPRATESPCFLIGQNDRGQWLAVESDGSGGGIFANREAAMRFVTIETNRRPEAMRFVENPIELRF